MYTYSHAVQWNSLDDFEGIVGGWDSIGVYQEICELKGTSNLMHSYKNFDLPERMFWFVSLYENSW